MWLATVAFTVLFAAVAFPWPAHAAATDPVITSPAPGAVLPNRWDGTVTVNLGAAPTDEYVYYFDCDAPAYVKADDSIYYESGFDDPIWSISAAQQIIGPATCEATITGVETGAYASARWTVQGPSVTFTSVDLAQATFFPLVRDGYADTATLLWTMTADATVGVEVRDAAGLPVKAASLGRLPAGGGYRQHAWVWDGLRQDGSLVSSGDYTLTVTAIGDDGIARSASRTVTAATGVRDSAWKTLKRAGAQSSGVTRGAGCLALYQRPGSAVTLDCSRGKRMVGTWRFSLPANVASVQHQVRGRYWGPQPRVVAKRSSATRYDVKVKVLRGMVTRIDKVVVRYKTRTPI